MNIFKRIHIKIDEMTVSRAIVIAGVLISLSIFLTVYIFFGGVNNRNKLFINNPNLNRNVTQVNQPQRMNQVTPPTNTAPNKIATTTIKK
jgi:hypothetical protein